MKFILKFTNHYGELFYFCNLGGFWHKSDTRRLIERTTPRADGARRFDTREAAQEVLTVAGAKRRPPPQAEAADRTGWEIVEVVE